MIFLDGIQLLRKSRTNPNKALPNPKKISNVINNQIVRKRRKLGEAKLRAEKQRPDGVVNQLFVFYGQFLDHDVSNSFPNGVNR